MSLTRRLGTRISHHCLILAERKNQPDPDLTRPADPSPIQPFLDNPQVGGLILGAAGRRNEGKCPA